jgi:fumarate reductase subunit C
MDGWWRRDPFFIHYMAREATAVLVVAYAVVLLVGLARLAQGQVAYEGWLYSLKSPLSIGFHIVLLAVFLYHTWSWFRIMPKTMPLILPDGKRVSPALVTGAGLAAAAIACIGLVAAAMKVAS